jgi:hypothetical protein
MGEVLRQLERSAALRELLKSRKQICFLCSWCLQDLDQNERFTGWPLDWNKSQVFPIDGKLIHILLELDAELPSDPESIEDLASVVAHVLETRVDSN